MGGAVIDQDLRSWGHFPLVDGASVVPAADLLRGAMPVGTWLPRGAGRSYGDVPLIAAGTLVTTSELDRIEHFDAATGRCLVQSGCTLAQIHHHVMPLGWHLNVVPGTQFVTVGGAIANDIHGKNHHVSGTFGRYVIGFELVRSDASTRWITAADHPDLFAATIGGLGLTGLITKVELQLTRIPSTAITTRSIKTATLTETMEVLREADATWPYSVAWVDLQGAFERRGRGHVLVGRHASSGAGYEPPSIVARHAWLGVVGRPFLQPAFVRLGNAVKYGLQRSRERDAVMSYRDFFHPLDGIARWNSVYDPRGFLQYQFVVPNDAGYQTIVDILRAMERADLPMYLAVLKRFGSIASPGWLSFPQPGWTLAMDIPIRRGTEPADLREHLDPIVVAQGGRLYPAKDAAMSAATFQRTYPAWTRMAEIKDPAITSAFWQRVTSL